MALPVGLITHVFLIECLAMSEAIAFDTHRFVKRLTESGFTETQAEALADEQVSLLNSNLATKQNLHEVKSELLKWMMGAIVAQTGVLAGLVLGLM